MMATKIEVDEFELDKAKFVLDCACVGEYNRKVKTRESRVYFEKLEKQAMRVNKAKNACQSVIDGRLSFGHGADTKKIWSLIQKKVNDIKCREGLVNEAAVSIIAIANWTVPALLSSLHQKVQSSIMGAVVNEGNNNIGIVVQPVWASTKGQVFDTTTSLLKLMENNNVVLDLNWSILFENKCDERDERPLNYPGRFCLGKNTERGDNIWMKTDLVSKGYVQVADQLKTRSMVEMADSSEEALPSACLQVHQKQSEKYHQLGVPTWETILGASIGTLKARNDVGRSAVLIVDTHARTGEVPLAFVQMLSQFRIPCYYFGLIADNKKVDEFASSNTTS